MNSGGIFRAWHPMDLRLTGCILQRATRVPPFSLLGWSFSGSAGDRLGLVYLQRINLYCHIATCPGFGKEQACSSYKLPRAGPDHKGRGDLDFILRLASLKVMSCQFNWYGFMA